MLVVAQKIPFVGTLQAQFLINIVSTGLAAVFFFLLGLELEYDRRAALVVALMYGLASPAWVYSKLLFRDPFVATALIALAYFLVRFRGSPLLCQPGIWNPGRRDCDRNPAVGGHRRAVCLALCHSMPCSRDPEFRSQVRVFHSRS